MKFDLETNECVDWRWLRKANYRNFGAEIRKENGNKETLFDVKNFFVHSTVHQSIIIQPRVSPIIKQAVLVEKQVYKNVSSQ